MVVGPRLVVNVRERLPCRYPTRTGPLRCDRAAPSAATNSSSMMPSMVVRIRSRINSSSAPFPCHPLLLSLSMASSSGTRLPAGASCGSTRRILTPFHFSTNFATLPLALKPVGQLALIEGLQIARHHGVELTDIVKRLNKIPWELDDYLWLNVLVMPSGKVHAGKTPVRLAAGIIARLVGAKYSTEEENLLLADYHKTFGDDSKSLPDAA